MVRDTVFGGQVNDIDIWIPSNCTETNVYHWISDLSTSGLITETPRIVFQGPTQINQENIETYRDMSNHWVIEFGLGGQKFNIMRTMSAWDDNDPGAFFTSLMRNFDIDVCMMFIGIPSGVAVYNTPNIIMPRHLVEALLNEESIRSFRWNHFRAATTSAQRLESRFRKMNEKYGLEESPIRIQQEDIEAVPVPCSFLLEHMDQLPLPRLNDDPFDIL